MRTREDYDDIVEQYLNPRQREILSKLPEPEFHFVVRRYHLRDSQEMWDIVADVCAACDLPLDNEEQAQLYWDRWTSHDLVAEFKSLERESVAMGEILTMQERLVMLTKLVRQNAGEADIRIGTQNTRTYNPAHCFKGIDLMNKMEHVYEVSKQVETEIHLHFDGQDMEA